MSPLIILMYALFASSLSAGKYILSNASYMFVVGSRFTIAGSILLSYYFHWQGQRVKIKELNLAIYAQIIFVGIYLGYLVRLWGLTYISAVKLALFFNASPFFTALLSYMLFREKMTLKQLFGLIIGFLGLLPIIITGSAEETEIGEFLFVSWPELAVLLAVALQSYTWILMRKLVKHEKHPTVFVNGVTMFFGGLLALMTSFWFNGLSGVYNAQAFWPWLMYVVIVSNVICANLYGYLLKHYTATFISFAGFITPFFTALYGWSFLGETITWHFYASCAIVFTGLYLFYQDELKSEPALP